jgi:hypothetical protein
LIEERDALEQLEDEVKPQLPISISVIDELEEIVEQIQEDLREVNEIGKKMNRRNVH